MTESADLTRIWREQRKQYRRDLINKWVPPMTCFALVSLMWWLLVVEAGR